MSTKSAPIEESSLDRMAEACVNSLMHAKERAFESVCTDERKPCPACGCRHSDLDEFRGMWRVRCPDYRHTTAPYGYPTNHLGHGSFGAVKDWNDDKVMKWDLVINDYVPFDKDRWNT